MQRLATPVIDDEPQQGLDLEPGEVAEGHPSANVSRVSKTSSSHRSITTARDTGTGSVASPTPVISVSVVSRTSSSDRCVTTGTSSGLQSATNSRTLVNVSGVSRTCSSHRYVTTGQDAELENVVSPTPFINVTGVSMTSTDHRRVFTGEGVELERVASPSSLFSAPVLSRTSSSNRRVNTGKGAELERMASPDYFINASGVLGTSSSNHSVTTEQGALFGTRRAIKPVALTAGASHQLGATTTRSRETPDADAVSSEAKRTVDSTYLKAVSSAEEMHRASAAEGVTSRSSNNHFRSSSLIKITPISSSMGTMFDFTGSTKRQRSLKSAFSDNSIADDYQCSHANKVASVTGSQNIVTVTNQPSTMNSCNLQDVEVPIGSCDKGSTGARQEEMTAESASSEKLGLRDSNAFSKSLGAQMTMTQQTSSKWKNSTPLEQSRFETLEGTNYVTSNAFDSLQARVTSPFTAVMPVHTEIQSREEPVAFPSLVRARLDLIPDRLKKTDKKEEVAGATEVAIANTSKSDTAPDATEKPLEKDSSAKLTMKSSEKKPSLQVTSTSSVNENDIAQSLSPRPGLPETLIAPTATGHRASLGITSQSPQEKFPLSSSFDVQFDTWSSPFTQRYDGLFRTLGDKNNVNTQGTVFGGSMTGTSREAKPLFDSIRSRPTHVAQAECAPEDLLTIDMKGKAGHSLQTARLPGSFFQKQEEKSLFDTSPSLFTRRTERESISDKFMNVVNKRETVAAPENSGGVNTAHEDKTLLNFSPQAGTQSGLSAISTFAQPAAAEDRTFFGSNSCTHPVLGDEYPFIVPVLDSETVARQLQHQVLQNSDSKYANEPSQNLEETATPHWLEYFGEKTPQSEHQSSSQVSSLEHPFPLEKAVISKHNIQLQQNVLKPTVKVYNKEGDLIEDKITKESYCEPYMDSNLRLYIGEELKGLTEFVRSTKKKIEESEALQKPLPLADDEIEVRSSKGMAALGVLQHEDYDEDGLFRTSEDDLLAAQSGIYYYEDNSLRGYFATDRKKQKSQVSGKTSVIPSYSETPAQYQDTNKENVTEGRHRKYTEYPFSEKRESLPLSEPSENLYLEIPAPAPQRTVPAVCRPEVPLGSKTETDHKVDSATNSKTQEGKPPSHLISRRSIAEIIEEIVQHHINTAAAQRQEKQVKETLPQTFSVYSPHRPGAEQQSSTGPVPVFYTATVGKNIRDEYVSDYRHPQSEMPHISARNVDQTPPTSQREQLGGVITSTEQRVSKCIIMKLDPNVSTYLVEVTAPEKGQNTPDMVMAEEQILVSEILDQITAPTVRTTSSGTNVCDQRPSIGLPSHSESLTRIRNAYAEAVARRVLSINQTREMDNMLQDFPRTKLLEQHTGVIQTPQGFLDTRKPANSIHSNAEVFVNRAIVSNPRFDHATFVSKGWLEKDSSLGEKESKTETKEANAKLTDNRAFHTEPFITRQAPASGASTNRTDITHEAGYGTAASADSKNVQSAVKVTISGTEICDDEEKVADSTQSAIKAAEKRGEKKYVADPDRPPLYGTIPAEKKKQEHASDQRTTQDTIKTDKTELVTSDESQKSPSRSMQSEENKGTSTGTAKETKLASTPTQGAPQSKTAGAHTDYCAVCEGALPLEKACLSFLCFGRHDLANYIATVPSESLNLFKLRIASDGDVKEVMFLPWKEEEFTSTVSASIITRRMVCPNGFYVAVEAAQEGYDDWVPYTLFTFEVTRQQRQHARGNICGTASILTFDEEVAFCGFFHLLQGYSFQDIGFLLWNQMLHTTGGKNVFTVLPQDDSQELLSSYPFQVSTVSPIMFGPVRLSRSAYKKKVLTLDYKDKYFDALVSYDKHVFGYSRKRFLDSTLQEMGLHVRVATRNERNVSGYGAIQKDKHGRPVLRWLMADDVETAESLMHSLLQLLEPGEEVEIVGAFYTRNAITRHFLDKVNICELRPWVLVYTKREPIYNCRKIAALTVV